MVETKWPADKVERRAIETLIPYLKNARTHSDAQIAQLANAMQEWGWTNPVLVDEAGVIIAGHGRVRAAQRLGWGEAPVMVATGWTDAQKRAYGLADNQLGMISDWDQGLLSMEISELALEGYDTSLLAFSPDQLTALDAGIFQPNLQPMSGSEQVTADELAKTAERLAITFTTAGKQDIADIMCPHCGQTFGVRRVDL